MDSPTEDQLESVVCQMTGGSIALRGAQLGPAFQEAPHIVCAEGPKERYELA